MTLVFAVVAAMLVAGCSSGMPINLTSGILPSFACQGKVMMIIQAGAIGAVNGINSIDCGDGFMLRQLQPVQVPAMVPPPAKTP